jgi:phosphatidylserine/phosphatidylglycerophosphate/cardiolipin synthase-like enzyme
MAERSGGGWARSAAGLAVLGVAAAFFYLQDLSESPISLVTDPHAAPIGSGAVISAFFTPPGQDEAPAPVEAALLASLESAQNSVDLALYDFDLWRVRDALLACQRRGVRVRMVVESDNGLQSSLADLRAAGVPIIGDGRAPLMHHKFLVIDDRIVWVGSMNLTIRGVYHNNNNFLRVDSADLAADFRGEFEEMFIEDRFGALSRPDTPYPFLVIGDSAVEVAFSPEDDVQARVVRRLNQATDSIDFMAFTLTADRIADAFLAAADRGVRVRAVIEADRAGNPGSDAGRLRAAGLDVRSDTNPDTMHNKVIIIDRRSVVTGSYNFTQSAEEHNDENLLIIDNPDLAGQYERVFQQLFDASLQ